MTPSSNKDFSKELTKLSNRYQTYIAYINTILTVAVSFFIGIFSYVITTWSSFKNNPPKLVLISFIFISLEIALIGVLIFLRKNKKEIEDKINELN